MKNSTETETERTIMLLETCIKEFKNINRLLDECFNTLEQNASVTDIVTNK